MNSKLSYTHPIRHNKVTSNVELSRFCRDIPGFNGVYDRTMISNMKFKHGDNCIINLDPKYKHNGTHWVCFRVSDHLPLVYYFDSFGSPPPAELTLKCRHLGLGIIYSDVVYQNINEDNCGQRCCDFLLKMHLGASKGKELCTFKKIAKIRDDKPCCRECH